jgi:hypothetical protein
MLVFRQAAMLTRDFCFAREFTASLTITKSQRMTFAEFYAVYSHALKLLFLSRGPTETVLFKSAFGLCRAEVSGFN